MIFTEDDNLIRGMSSQKGKSLITQIKLKTTWEPKFIYVTQSINQDKAPHVKKLSFLGKKFLDLFCSKPSSLIAGNNGQKPPRNQE